MKKNKIVFSSFVAILLSQQILHAKNEAVKLEKASLETEVYEESSIGSKSFVNAKKMKIASSAEQLNPYKAVSLEAGVDIRNNDPFGMSVTHKIRGKSSSVSSVSLEGLALKGPGPGSALPTMVDMENLKTISVEKGAVKADSGFGFGNDGGMVDMKIKRPLDEFSTEIKQSLGSYNFRKTYLRVDSGKVSDIAKVFISSSLTDADKFKGSGKSVDRKNFSFGITNTSNQNIEWEVYGIYTDLKSHAYKGLTYEQSKNLSRYHDLDFQDTDNTSGDYYDYTKTDFQTYTIISKLKIPLGDENSLSVRPYFLNHKGTRYIGNGSNVIDWFVDHNTYGTIVEYEHKVDDAKIKLGYWYQIQEAPYPPLRQKMRDANGLGFKKWVRLVDATKQFEFQAPYATYELSFGNTIIEAGLKYLWLKSPELVNYNTAGIGDVSNDTALSQASVIDFTLPRNTSEVFLPNIGITHYLNDNSYATLSYGRNYNVPAYYFGASMQSVFQKIGKDQSKIRQMWANIKPEISDNIDIGYSYSSEKTTFNTTAFYSKVKNVGGTFYDPVYDMEYTQNSAEAQSYGLEIAAKYQFNQKFFMQTALTYNKYAFTKDIQSDSNSYIKTKGNQLPDVPLFFGNVSAEYDLEGYKITPIVRYLGKRYVDVTHNYDIGDSFLVDLSVNKEFKLDRHKLSLSLACTNLFDKKYISTFSASDINIIPETTYTVGAPRTFFASLSYKY